MTNEEMQRAIEFVLKTQAGFEVQLAQTNQQVAQTNQQVAQTNQQVEQVGRKVEEVSMLVLSLADTQGEFMQVMTRQAEAQGKFNATMRREMRELAQAQRQTQQDLSKLTKVVGDLTTTVYKNDGPPTAQ